MKHTLLIAASVAVLGLSACKKEPQPATEATTAAPATDMAAPIAPVPVSAAQAFANTAASSDAFEIEISRLAADKAQSAEVKRFAEQMITAHTASTAKLRTAAAAAVPPVVPDPMLTAAQRSTIDTLATKSGAAFDQEFARIQVDAHQATLDVLKAYAATGEVPSLKSFAAELVPTVTAHLNMAKAL